MINKSIHQNYGPGLRVLGEMYEKGEGIEQNLAIAIDMYKCAVEAGYKEAENELNRILNHD